MMTQWIKQEFMSWYKYNVMNINKYMEGEALPCNNTWTNKKEIMGLENHI